MKLLLNFAALFFLTVQMSFAQENSPSARPTTKDEQEVLDLSKQKWEWMADKKIDTLNGLFVI